MRFVSGSHAMQELLSACGFDPKAPYQRLVLVCDVNDVPKVYATKVVTADDALRVVETLKGVVVTADPDAVEVVALTEPE